MTSVRAVAIAALLAPVAGGCRSEASRPAPPTDVAASSSPPASPPSSSASASASAASAPSPALPPLSVIVPACCTMDRTDGIFGSEKNVYTRYSGDFVRRKDGERLLFPQDLINDTKELYQHAKSAGRSIEQTRRVKVVGEGTRYLSVEIVDRGETGVTPFSHSSCKTIDLSSGRVLRVEDIAKERAAAVLAEGRKKLESAPGHEGFRFLPSSFAVLGKDGERIRFCAPRKDDSQGDARLDVEVPASP